MVVGADKQTMIWICHFIGIFNFAFAFGGGVLGSEHRALERTLVTHVFTIPEIATRI